MSNLMHQEAVLPKGWKWTSLGEVVSINPKIKNKENIPSDLIVQFLPMKLVEEKINKIHLTETRTFSEVQKGSYTPFVDGDILFAKVTPCMENGKVAVTHNLKNGIGFGSSEFHVLRSSNETFNKFLFYFVVQDKFRNEAQNVMTGAVGLRRVPKQFIENYKIPLPPRPAQQIIVSKIEELFSDLDKGIENLRLAQQQLKTYRQTVLKWAFEKLENENTIEEITESSLIGLVRSSKDQNYENAGVPYVKMNNIDLNGNVDFSELVYVEASQTEIERFHLKKGDILINTRNSFELVGKTGIVREEKTKAVFNNNLLRIRVKNCFMPLFIGYQLINPSLKAQMLKEKKATTNVWHYIREIYSH